MPYYKEALCLIKVGDWSRAAESIACHIYGDKFLEMSPRCQGALLQTLATHLVIENIHLNSHLPSYEKPIETRLAQEICEKTCSHLRSGPSITLK